MSYCRWSDTSDVYVYADVRGGWTTHHVDGTGGTDPTREACLLRLFAYRRAGGKVPDAVLEHLVDEIQRENRRRDEECERLRIQLAGVSCAALANTPESHRAAELTPNDDGWSLAYQDTWDAVTREIARRDERDELAAQISLHTTAAIRNLKAGRATYRGELRDAQGTALPYDPTFGDDRVCECGHVYYRHFDTYDQMSPIGCKYCHCTVFLEAMEGVR